MLSRVTRSLPVLLALCIGCGAQDYKTYEGAEKPDAEVAVLKHSYIGTGGVKSDRAEILGVDDIYFDGDAPDQVEVLPGEHSVEIRCWHGRLLVEDSFGLQGHQGSIDFIAEAGHEYQAYCTTSKGAYVRWITDLSTDEVVAGHDPRAPEN